MSFLLAIVTNKLSETELWWIAGSLLVFALTIGGSRRLPRGSYLKEMAYTLAFLAVVAFGLVFYLNYTSDAPTEAQANENERRVVVAYALDAGFGKEKTEIMVQPRLNTFMISIGTCLDITFRYTYIDDRVAKIYVGGDPADKRFASHTDVTEGADLFLQKFPDCSPRP